MKKSTWIFGVGAAVGAALAAKSVSDFQRDRRVALARLRGRSDVVQTANGPVEYAIEGDGAAVLLSHGAAGGYDQSLILSRLLKGSGFKTISVSRGGYLRSPLITGWTADRQADTYAALLDELNIEGAAIVGLSAGGPSAIQFALRHPDRCWGLVMVSAISQPLTILPPFAIGLQKAALISDFLPWLLFKAAERSFLSLLGINTELMHWVEQDSETVCILHELLNPVATMSERRMGIVNDIEQVAALPAYPLDKIAAPTFVIHSPTDPLVPFAQAEHIAQCVPGAKLLTIDEGGHLCVVTHRERTVPAMLDFLTHHAPK